MSEQERPVLTHVFQIIEDKQQGFIFFKDGRQVPCHKQMPMMAETVIQGQPAQIMRLPCSSNCAKANVYKYADGRIGYQVLCDGTPLMYPITPNAEKEDSQSKLVKM